MAIVAKEDDGQEYPGYFLMVISTIDMGLTVCVTIVRLRLRCKKNEIFPRNPKKIMVFL